MYTERNGKQIRMEMVTLEELVPENHLLRKIDKAIDFSFINKICKPYYCENNGRPARRFTNEEKKRWSAALPIRKNCMGSGI